MILFLVKSFFYQFLFGILGSLFDVKPVVDEVLFALVLDRSVVELEVTQRAQRLNQHLEQYGKTHMNFVKPGKSQVSVKGLITLCVVSLAVFIFPRAFHTNMFE